MLTFIREDWQLTRRGACVASLVLLLVVHSTALTSEQSANTTRNGADTYRDSAAQHLSTGNAARERLQQRAAQLSQLREQLLSDLASVQRAAPDVPVDLRPTILDAIERGLHDAKLEREQRLQSLRGRLSQLDELLQQQACTESDVNDEGPLPPGQVPTKFPQPAAPTEPENANETETETQLDAVPLTDAIPILKEPVDRLAMADNLFATREMRLALELYESIDANQLDPEDRLWVWYQIGCCQRVLGDQAEAEKFFRMVVGSSSSGSLFDNARWSLESIQNRAAIERRLAKLSEALDTLGRETNESDATSAVGN